MSDVPIIIRTGGAEPSTGAPIFPTHSVEFINTLAHYYRGEMSRMISWRDRIDRTTNWAIGTVAAMLSVTLSRPDVHHSVILFAMLVVALLLGIEARRYRFFHVYRSRVRLMERNYYAQVFAASDLRDPSAWMRQLADDLRIPRFNLTMAQAVARRLRRTYFWMFAILLLAWVLKGSLIAPGDPHWSQAYAIGWIPGWGIIAGMCVFFGAMACLMYLHRERPGELAFGEVHM
jgi:uncharacterized membrane protein